MPPWPSSARIVYGPSVEPGARDMARLDYTPVSLGGARRQTALVWYRDDEVQGVEEFLDPAEAEEWANWLIVSFSLSTE